jgi:hypothetical protein
LLMTLMGISLFGCVNYIPTPATPLVTLSPEQVDNSPFTGIPCAAPCWRGLEVGKSTEKDALEIVATLTFINQESVQVYRRPSMPDYHIMDSGPGIEIDANCINSEKICLNLTTANDVVQKIVVGLNYEIGPDEAIAYLGTPDVVVVLPIGSEIFVCDVDLVWKNSRLVLTSTFRADTDLEGVKKYCDGISNTAKVPSSLLISEARYLSDVELNALLAGGKVFEFTGTIPDQ